MNRIHPETAIPGRPSALNQDSCGAAMAQNECKASSERREFDFSEALWNLKRGRSVARSNWNAPNQYVYLNYGAFDRGPRDSGQPINGVPLHLFTPADSGTVTRLPNLNLHTAQGNTLTGWVASQTDLLAEDWYLVEMF